MIYIQRTIPFAPPVWFITLFTKKDVIVAVHEVGANPIEATTGDIAQEVAVDDDSFILRYVLLAELLAKNQVLPVFKRTYQFIDGIIELEIILRVPIVI